MITYGRVLFLIRRKELVEKMSITVLLGSSRSEGNSEQLTQKVLAGIDAAWIKLNEKTIRPIVDQRHDPQGFAPVNDEYESVISQVLVSDTLIFSTPLYWYGMSGLMKNFIDRWSQSLRDTRYEFRDQMRGKKCYLVVTGGSEVYVKALPMVQQFNLICEFMGMEFTGYLIGKGTKPGEVLQDQRAIFSAEQMNQQLKSF